MKIKILLDFYLLILIIRSKFIFIFQSSDSNSITKLQNVAKIPPQFTPIQCKPLYFDLALNHIELPVLEEKSESNTQQGQGQGIKGLLKGFLGFK